MHHSGVSTVNFKYVIACWDINTKPNSQYIEILLHKKRIFDVNIDFQVERIVIKVNTHRTSR